MYTHSVVKGSDPQRTAAHMPTNAGAEEGTAASGTLRRSGQAADVHEAPHHRPGPRGAALLGGDGLGGGTDQGQAQVLWFQVGKTNEQRESSICYFIVLFLQTAFRVSMSRTVKCFMCV